MNSKRARFTVRCFLILVEFSNSFNYTLILNIAQNVELKIFYAIVSQYHAFVNAVAIDDYHGNVTALDYALQSQNDLLVDYLRQHGALTGKDIQHLAACKIQQYWRRYRRIKEIKSLQV